MSDIASEPGAEAAPAPDTSGAPETTQAPQAPEIDFGPLMERFERIEQQLQPPEPEPEPEADPYASLSDMGYSDEETQATRQVLDNIVQSRLESILGQRLGINGNVNIADALARVDRLELDLNLGDLEERYPALQDDKVAEEILGVAGRIAQRAGNPALHRDPELLEALYLAKVGREQAQRERPAGQPGAELEQPGGASPPEPEPDVNAAILGAQPKTNFWGY